MFDEKDILKYRSIKAPDELKGRIEEALFENKKEKHFSVKPFIAVAASFVVILSVLLVSGLSFDRVSLMYNGQTITDEGYSIDYSSQPQMARLNVDIQIPFELKGRGEVEITVSDGVLAAEGTEEGKSLKLVLSGKETIYLKGVSFEDLPLELTCKEKNRTVVYVISSDGTVYKDAETKN